MSTRKRLRTQSEAKRLAMLGAAVEQFNLDGFERAQMDEIARRASCSKVTLYAYFKSKEHLFHAAIVAATEEQFGSLYQVLSDTQLPAGDVLRRFGEGFIKAICSPEVRALRRLTVGIRTGEFPELRNRLYDEGPTRAITACANFFRHAERREELVVKDYRIAALQLRALLEAEWLDTLLYDRQERVTKRSVSESTDRAVTAFLTLYGVK